MESIEPIQIENSSSPTLTRSIKGRTRKLQSFSLVKWAISSTYFGVVI